MKIIDKALLDATSARALASPRLRMNHNFHERLDDPVNRLLNAMEPGTYLPVHRHTTPPKDEMIVILRGRLASFTFDDEGKILEKAVIDPREGVYGFDIPAGVWHCALVLESGTVAYEVKAGPYAAIGENDIAPWSPDAADTDDVEAFIRRLEYAIK